MTIHWNKLRFPQENAFEELCCQLARFDTRLPAGSKFVRKGAPDAGLECFWTLPSGEEWGWQAKFFCTSPTDSQWQQLDESFATATAKHPRLTRYIVALPVDLPDARTGRGKSALAKWNDRVVKWTSQAKKLGISVLIELWGHSELTQQLSQERHRGTHWYWFDTQALSTAWFGNHAAEAIANAGSRYTPELHIDTSIANYFHAFGRSKAYFARLAELLAELRAAGRAVHIPNEPQSLRIHYEKAIDQWHTLVDAISPWVMSRADECLWTHTSAMPWPQIDSMTEDLHDAIGQCIGEIESIRESRREIAEREGKTIPSYPRDEFDYPLDRLYKLSHSIADWKSFANSHEAELSNSSSMLLVGQAGQGKTHTLCDVTKREVADGLPRILLFGEQFHDEEPWSQMIRLLGLQCTPDEFIGGLQAAAIASKSRAVIFIDALNEGAGNRLWKKFLSGMLVRIATTDWISICVTIRDIYELHVIPDSLFKLGLQRVEHQGFGDESYAAATKFFAHFGVEPSTPHLLPEFDNPLFLKLFCTGLRNAGLTRVPTGLRGITSIFDFYMDSIDAKLSRPTELNYDPRQRLAVKALNSLADEMAKLGTDRLPLDRARDLVHQHLPPAGHDQSLFQRLEAESIIAVAPDYWSEEDDFVEYVRFTYQRFSDHRLTHLLLDQHIDPKDPSVSFVSHTPLGSLICDESACRQNQGIVDALAIQLPERIRRELHEVASHLKGFHSLRDAMVESIVWRDSKSFTEATYNYINDEILRFRKSSEDFWDTVVMLGPTPDHPLNADKLHRVLLEDPMADRDEWWSTFLHREVGKQRAVDRLIDWARKHSQDSVYDEEVLRLIGILLAWFLTSSNRRLRDCATKGLVRLYDNRLIRLTELLELFADVDDLYVKERLMAVAYGCAMRSRSDTDLGKIAQYVYTKIFKQRKPPVHLLLRDYARGVIECAIVRGCTLSIEPDSIRPPYNSEWPEIFPSEGDVAPFSAHPFYGHITSPYDDFSKVVADFSEWRAHRLNFPRRPPRKDLVDEFVESLTTRQHEQWEVVSKLYQQLLEVSRASPSAAAKTPLMNSGSALRAQIKEAEQTLVARLRAGSKKAKTYTEVIREYLQNPHKFWNEFYIDADGAQRWMAKKVMDLGWTADRFGKFDREFRTGRDAVNRQESIGKKYAWIALRELEARCSDTFELRWHYGDSGGLYEGPWEISYGREIDPSMLLTSTGRESYQPHANNWWFPTRVKSWREENEHLDWLRRTDDLPNPLDLIKVQTPDGQYWIALAGNYRWEQPNRPGEKRWETPARSIEYWLNAYFVRKQHVKRVVSWANGKRWDDLWMPHSNSTQKVFLGEFWWGRSYQPYELESPERTQWSSGDAFLPAPMLIAYDAYGYECTASDCALDDSISLKLPSRFVADRLQLRMHTEAHWYNSVGSLVAIDPSASQAGPSTLLVRKDELLRLLVEDRLEVFWTLTGVRTLVGGRDDHGYVGHAEINGSYVTTKGTISGSYKSRFFAPGTWTPAHSNSIQK